jgi:hypothetical protein
MPGTVASAWASKRQPRQISSLRRFAHHWGRYLQCRNQPWASPGVIVRSAAGLTDRAHIITAGTDSYRFRRTTAQRKAAKP